MLKVFDDKTAGYEQYIRDHWNELEDWERAHYARFSQWTADRKQVKRYVTQPVELPDARPSYAGQKVIEASSQPQSIALAYALALVGIVFFPFILESAAILLALVNMICRRWEHAMLQLGIALAVLS